jgi:hypothetical protein
MRINLGAIASGIANKFVDSFNRADSATTLGTSDNGDVWQTVNGTVGIGTNQASAFTAHSGYPSAKVTVPSANVDILVNSAAEGTGALLWATDSANWWSVDTYKYTYTSCNAYGVNGYYACGNAASNFTCINYNYYTSCTGGYNVRGTCNGYNHAYYKNGTYCQAYNYNCASWSTNQGSCAYGSTYSFNNAFCASGYYCASSTTYFPTYLRILRSLAGSVTSIVEAYLGNAVGPQSLKVSVRGTAITAVSYTGTAQDGATLNTLTYDATGATVTPQYGIVFTPSTINEHNTIDSVTINRVD